MAEAFNNLYIYIVSIAGIIAFMVLIYTGILYVTSAGSPDKLKKARERFIAIFFGLAILFLSYIILGTINPNLVSFEIPSLDEVIINPIDQPPLEARVPTLLERVKELAEKIDEEAGPGVERAADEIQDSTLECGCWNAQSSCMCSGGSDNDDCEDQGCYIGPRSHPCRDWKQIQENQKLVVAWKDELVYYKNRGLAEAKDLEQEIEDALDPEIDYFEELRSAEEDPIIIQYYNEEIAKLEQEKDLKEDLIRRLRILALLVELIKVPAEELASLPNKCIEDEEGTYGVENTCEGTCIGDCHDTFTGCQPLPCVGLNPCPFLDILAANAILQPLGSEIRDNAEEILDIINQLINLKTIFI